MSTDHLSSEPAVADIICRSCGAHGLHWLPDIYILCDGSGGVHACRYMNDRRRSSGRRHDDSN